MTISSNSKDFLLEYMLNYFTRLENDRQIVINRISVHRLDSKDVYDMVVVDTRIDTARDIFRSIRLILDTYD